MHYKCHSDMYALVIRLRIDYGLLSISHNCKSHLVVIRYFDNVHKRIYLHWHLASMTAIKKRSTVPEIDSLGA